MLYGAFLCSWKQLQAAARLCRDGCLLLWRGEVSFTSWEANSNEKTNAAAAVSGMAVQGQFPGSLMLTCRDCCSVGLPDILGDYCCKSGHASNLCAVAAVFSLLVPLRLFSLALLLQLFHCSSAPFPS